MTAAPLDGPALAALGVGESARRFALWVQACAAGAGWCSTTAGELARDWGTTDRSVRRWCEELAAKGAWAVVQLPRLSLRALVFLRGGRPVGQLAFRPAALWSLPGGAVGSAELLSMLGLPSASGTAGEERGAPEAQAAPQLSSSRSRRPARASHPRTAMVSALPRTSERQGGADIQVSEGGGGADTALSDPQRESSLQGLPSAEFRKQQQLLPRTSRVSEPAPASAGAPEVPLRETLAGRSECPTCGRADRSPSQHGRGNVREAAGALQALQGLGLDPDARRLVLEGLSQLAQTTGHELDQLAASAAAWSQSQARPAAALCTAIRRGYLAEVLERQRAPLGPVGVFRPAAGAAPSAGPAGSPQRKEDPMARAWDGEIEALTLSVVQARHGLADLEGRSDPEAAMERCRLENRLGCVAAAVRAKVPGGTSLEHLIRAHMLQLSSAPANTTVSYRGGIEGWRAAAESGALERLALWARDWTTKRQEGAA